MMERDVYVRCPHCRGSFPVRRTDIDTFLGAETPNPYQRCAVSPRPDTGADEI
jgi:hypothetical protein